MPTKLSINIEVRNTLRRFFVFHEKKVEYRPQGCCTGDRTASWHSLQLNNMAAGVLRRGGLGWFAVP